MRVDPLFVDLRIALDNAEPLRKILTEHLTEADGSLTGRSACWWMRAQRRWFSRTAAAVSPSVLEDRLTVSQTRYKMRDPNGE